MPPNTVRVTRPGRWGNPFLVEEIGLERCLDMFRDMLLGFFSPGKLAELSDDEFRVVYDRMTAWKKRIQIHPGEAVRHELRGLNLACWCSLDQPCHADILLAAANEGSFCRDRDAAPRGRAAAEAEGQQPGPQGIANPEPRRILRGKDDAGANRGADANATGTGRHDAAAGTL